MLRPAPRRVLRKTGVVLLQIAGGIVAFAVLMVAGTFAAKGLIMAIAAVPWWR
jgi:hypothetical protein